MTVALRLACTVEMHACFEMCSSWPDSSVSPLTSVYPRCNQNCWWPVPEKLKRGAGTAWAKSKASLEDTQSHLLHKFAQFEASMMFPEVPHAACSLLQNLSSFLPKGQKVSEEIAVIHLPWGWLPQECRIYPRWHRHNEWVKLQLGIKK